MDLRVTAMDLDTGSDETMSDSTMRKLVEEKLREGDAKFRAIVQATPECVKMLSRDGILLEMNPAGLRMIGIDHAEDVIGQCVYDLIAPEHRPAYREFNSQVCGGVGGSLEFDMIRPDGTRRNMESTAIPMPDAQGRLMHLAVTRDVTDRKRSETDRSLLAAIIESSDDVIVSKTLDGIITSWNKGAERILGYSAEEVIGQHVSMLMPPDAMEDTTKILNRIRRGEKVDHYETRRRRKDGTIIDVSLTVSPVRNAAGTIVGASKVGRDVTEQKRTARAPSEANMRKDEFLAMLAHELRNPLSAVSNAVLVARRRAE